VSRFDILRLTGQSALHSPSIEAWDLHYQNTGSGITLAIGNCYTCTCNTMYEDLCVTHWLQKIEQVALTEK